MFTSRSAVECYQGECNRKRYLQYHLNGKGVVRVQKSVPLVTGGAIHRGVEHLGNRLRIGQEPDVDTAVQLAIEQYIKDCEEAGFRDKAIRTDRQQWFTFNEQKALVEALVRVWAIKELPILKEHYTVLAVEREIEPIEIAPDIWFQAKVDMELQRKSDGAYLNYSLKTIGLDLKKDINGRYEESYKSDLQGCTEIWAVEEDDKRETERVKRLVESLEKLNDSRPLKYKQFDQIQKYLKKVCGEPRLVSGIRFCFLVKGKRMIPPSQKKDEDAIKVTYNPLIRGYKRLNPTSIDYAHSWDYPNENGGRSKLGSGWEPFNVWETDFGVKGWIKALEKGEIQPQCGDIIGNYVSTPPEYWRGEREMEEAMREVRLQEQVIKRGLELMESAKLDDSQKTIDEMLALVFSHNRKHCYFSFGDTCEYLDLCFKDEVREDPLGSGLYQIRTPHHQAELEAIAK